MRVQSLEWLKVGTAQDRFCGAIVGGAVGDALGATNEFRSRADCQKKPVQGMTGGGVWDLQPGEWTDDTSLLLCVAEGLLDSHAEGGIDPYFDIAGNMTRWAYDQQTKFHGTAAKRGAFDIGGTTRESIARLARYMDAETEDNEVQIWQVASPLESDSGNGSLMRAAPSALCCDPATHRRIGRLTHRSELCVEACTAFQCILKTLVTGKKIKAALDVGYYSTDNTLVRNAIIRGKIHPLRTLPTTGYVIDTLAMAVAGLTTIGSFHDIMLAIANQGGDSDTNCCVYGQLAGGYLGLSKSPKKWLDSLYRADYIIDTSRQLWDAFGRLEFGEGE